MNPVSLTIHRSAAEIGGNCIELTAPDESRLILDAGRSLNSEGSDLALLPPTLDLTRPVAGVLLSHAHQDHYGLLQALPESWPVYCGQATATLINLTSGILGKPGHHDIVYTYWKSKKPFQAGPFKVTPYLTDHSAFDAYMLLVEIAGKRILYSGDFRMHGRKSALVEGIMARPPKDLDVLIMEGTNLGGGKSCQSETELESEFVELFSATPGRVFVAWSPQNVDRTVTLFRACTKARRTLVVDLYAAEVMEALKNYGRLPIPDWQGLKVVITSRLASHYIRTGREEVTKRMVDNGLSAKKLAETPGRWVIMTRASLLADFTKKGVVPTDSDAWCWSMWRGYLEQDSGRAVADWFSGSGAKARHIHTSGHASIDDLKVFAQRMDAARLIPVHGQVWDEATDLFPRLYRLADGERCAI